MTALSTAEYLDLRSKSAAFESWRGNRTSYHPSEVPAEVPTVSNDELSAIEVFEFVTAPPEKYVLYISDKRDQFKGPGNVTPIGLESLATTWTGDRLGTVFMGREYRDNFGGRRVPITVKAINGRTYHGTYFKSSGDYARIKLAKGA